MSRGQNNRSSKESEQAVQTAGLVRLTDDVGGLIDRSRRHPQTRLSSIESNLTALQTGLSDGVLSSALADLRPLIEEIRADTEMAANAIIDACEALQEGKDADGALADIFTACGFQDIIGQRCDRARQLLDVVSNGATEMSESSSRDIEKSAGLLDGPSGHQNSPSQEEIDKLFSDSGVD